MTCFFFLKCMVQLWIYSIYKPSPCKRRISVVLRAMKNASNTIVASTFRHVVFLDSSMSGITMISGRIIYCNKKNVYQNNIICIIIDLVFSTDELYLKNLNVYYTTRISEAFNSAWLFLYIILDREQMIIVILVHSKLFWNKKYDNWKFDIYLDVPWKGLFFHWHVI